MPVRCHPPQPAHPQSQKAHTMNDCEFDWPWPECPCAPCRRNHDENLIRDAWAQGYGGTVITQHDIDTIITANQTWYPK